MGARYMHASRSTAAMEGRLRIPWQVSHCLEDSRIQTVPSLPESEGPKGCSLDYQHAGTLVTHHQKGMPQLCAL